MQNNQINSVNSNVSNQVFPGCYARRIVKYKPTIDMEISAQ